MNTAEFTEKDPVLTLKQSSGISEVLYEAMHQHKAVGMLLTCTDCTWSLGFDAPWPDVLSVAGQSS